MQSIHLEDIAQKAVNGQRLSPEDGLALLRSDDLISLGEMAHTVKTAEDRESGVF